MNYGPTIKKLRAKSELTQEEFAQKIGITRSSLASIEIGRFQPDDEMLQNIATLCDVTVEHIKADAEHNPKKEMPDSLPEGENEPYLIRRRRQKQTPKGPVLVPFVPVKAQAGYVRAIDQEIYLDTLERFALPPGISGHGAIWRYWEIEGDSMEPVFKSGDIILTSLVHPMDWENMRNFYTYVIVTADRVLIKRIYCKNPLEWVLISENEENYPQQLLPVEYIKEVWVYRRTWSTRAEPTKRFEIKV